jgi:hypothetical protein
LRLARKESEGRSGIFRAASFRKITKTRAALQLGASFSDIAACNASPQFCPDIGAIKCKAFTAKRQRGINVAEQDMQTKLTAALRAQPKPSPVRSPVMLAGGALAVALLAGAAFLFWPSDDALVIHASDRAGVEADLRRMTASLPEGNKEAYQSGFLTLILDRYPPASGLDGFARLALMEAALDASPQTMDGVTVEDILAAGRANLDRIAEKDTAAAQTVAQKGQLAECLTARLPITNARVVRGDYGRTLTYTVTNNLSWAISGIYISYDITSKGRSVPWETNDGALSIAGGLEPGETKELRYPLSLFPADAPDDLVVTARTIDVADAQQRQLVRDVRIIDWSEALSDQTCK